MGKGAVFKSQQSVGLYRFGIEFHLGLHVLCDDVDQGGILLKDALSDIRQGVYGTVYAVPVLAEDLQLVVFIVPEPRADDAEEEPVLLLLFDQLLQAALVGDSEIKVSVSNEDHLIVPAAYIVGSADLIGRLDARRAVGESADLKGKELLQSVDPVLFSPDLHSIENYLVTGAVGDKAEPVSLFQLTDNGGHDSLGILAVGRHGSGYIQKDHNVLLFGNPFHALYVDIEILFSFTGVCRFQGDPEGLLSGHRGTVAEVIQHFLNADHALVDPSAVAELIEHDAGGSRIGGHAEGGRLSVQYADRILFLDGFIFIRGKRRFFAYRGVRNTAAGSGRTGRPGKGLAFVKHGFGQLSFYASAFYTSAFFQRDGPGRSAGGRFHFRHRGGRGHLPCSALTSCRSGCPAVR